MPTEKDESLHQLERLPWWGGEGALKDWFEQGENQNMVNVNRLSGDLLPGKRGQVRSEVDDLD